MEQLEKNIIEVAEDDSPPYVHYLAHHGVISESKNILKYPASSISAKKKGSPSLNELLHKGPNLLPDLLGVLLRVRTMPILISGDIEKAFRKVASIYDPFGWSTPVTLTGTIAFRNYGMKM
ncbi:hypothetical protein TELCIR_17037 [Teladorsagia circumcincta]|uniref:Uncharacterized protein n=1 Tax=Teladorsagia circumcincta TaxID=45464 RepID=A0A2G9TTV1_TELCI|nr:hypothetical protein TELCIR_17037 [Teladorsagia circumcincta]